MERFILHYLEAVEGSAYPAQILKCAEISGFDQNEVKRVCWKLMAADRLDNAPDWKISLNNNSYVNTRKNETL